MRVLLIVIFSIFAFFYLLQWAVRAVLRWKLNSIQKEMARQGRQAQTRGRRQRTPREGEVRVDAGKAPERKINERIGDYVEYEEVEIMEEEKTKQ